jgi:hypothetical protein
MADIYDLIKQLASLQPSARTTAREALVEIGAPAVEPLCTALAHPHWHVREHSAEALRDMADPRSAEALCKALSDAAAVVRSIAREALVQIGLPAVEALCKAQGVHDANARWQAAEALGQIGDRRILPRKLLLDTSMPLRQRANALNALHSTRAQYIVGGTHGDTYLRYEMPPPSQFCEQMLQHPEAELRRAAEEMLQFLAGDTLLRASQADGAGGDTLLRAASGAQTDESGDTLLRGASGEQTDEPGGTPLHPATRDPRDEPPTRAARLRWPLGRNRKPPTRQE